jgi:hypothetical protein
LAWWPKALPKEFGDDKLVDLPLARRSVWNGPPKDRIRPTDWNLFSGKFSMPRFTIRNLMIAVCVAAGLLGIYRAGGVFPLVVASFSLAMTGGAWLAFSHNPRLAIQAFAVSAIAANLLVAILGVYFLNMTGFVLMFLVSAALVPFALGSGSAWAWTHPRRNPKAAASVLVLVLGLLPISMMLTSWPLRLASALSRPSMDRLADRLAAGETLASPEWAGMYRIVAADHEPRNGNVILVTDPNSSGRSGFVRVSDPSQSLGQMYNLNLDVPVGGSWRYQNED